jgi:uncharacterized integral membrane protein
MIGKAAVVTALENNPRLPAPAVERPARYEEAVKTVGRPTVPRTRVGGLRAAIVAFAVVLLLLMIFLLQNGRPAEVSFFGAHGQLPMGVALLLAAIFGVLLVALPGTVRIVQLRMLARRRSPDGIGQPPTTPSEAAIQQDSVLHTDPPQVH